MQTTLDQNPFFQFLINPAPRYRIARHGLLWTTAILAIYRGQLYISRNSNDPDGRSLYVALATFTYAVLIIIIYVAVAQLIRRFILLRFRISYLVLGFFVIHLVVSVSLYYQLKGFLSYFALTDLPQFYATQVDRLSQLSIWRIPFDSFIVGIMSYSLVYSYVLYPLFLKIKYEEKLN